MILLMQHPDDAPFSSLSRMGGILADFQPDRFVIAKNGGLELDRLHELLQDPAETVTLFGTALAFLNLLEEIPDLRLDLPPGSIVMETGGFKGSGQRDRQTGLVRSVVAPSWRRHRLDLERVRNDRIEFAILFPRRRTLPPGPALDEISDHRPGHQRGSASGEIGLLRIIDLANLWSVLAVLTQDLAIAQPDGGFLLLGRDPDALPRGCSRAMDELMQSAAVGHGMKLDDRIAAIVSAAAEFSWLGDLTSRKHLALDRVGAWPISERSRTSILWEPTLSRGSA